MTVLSSNDGNIAITATGSLSGSSSSASLTRWNIWNLRDNSLTGSFSNSGNITIVASADADASSSGNLNIDDVYGLELNGDIDGNFQAPEQLVYP